mmetsp:Transcript_26455/g.63486  ORF Transcript_26455/g.63486 Transcript_26455/m.63486 type:complete len:206 (-) Transcript_26455:971-1588(-)
MKIWHYLMIQRIPFLIILNCTAVPHAYNLPGHTFSSLFLFLIRPPIFLLRVRCRKGLVVVSCNFHCHLLQTTVFTRSLPLCFFCPPVHFCLRQTSSHRFNRCVHISRHHGLLHKLIYSELDANHRHHTQQTRRKTSVKSPKTFFCQDPSEAVIDPFVWDEIWVIHLCYKSCLDRIHWYHDTDSCRASHATHDRVFNIFCWALRHC